MLLLLPLLMMFLAGGLSLGLVQLLVLVKVGLIMLVFVFGSSTSIIIVK
jgi:hypothetical protein